MLHPIQDPDYCMRQALQMAQMAYENEEVPVGAIITCGDQIIAKSHNQVEQLNDVTAHAEMLAITSASNYLGSKYLNECTLYVTLEPCLMCATALAWSQIGNIVYGASDFKKGFSNYEPSVFSSKINIVRGIHSSNCSELLTAFFQIRR